MSERKQLWLIMAVGFIVVLIWAWILLGPVVTFGGD